jgi:hypothetical protein
MKKPLLLLSAFALSALIGMAATAAPVPAYVAQAIDAPPPGVGLAEATDINSRGEIAAVGTDNRRYLLRPSNHDAP